MRSARSFPSWASQFASNGRTGSYARSSATAAAGSGTARASRPRCGTPWASLSRLNPHVRCSSVRQSPRGPTQRSCHPRSWRLHPRLWRLHPRLWRLYPRLWRLYPPRPRPRRRPDQAHAFSCRLSCGRRPNLHLSTPSTSTSTRTPRPCCSISSRASRVITPSSPPQRRTASASCSSAGSLRRAPGRTLAPTTRASPPSSRTSCAVCAGSQTRGGPARSRPSCSIPGPKTASAISEIPPPTSCIVGRPLRAAQRSSSWNSRRRRARSASMPTVGPTRRSSCLHRTTPKSGSRVWSARSRSTRASRCASRRISPYRRRTSCCAGYARHAGCAAPPRTARPGAR